MKKSLYLYSLVVVIAVVCSFFIRYDGWFLPSFDDFAEQDTGYTISNFHVDVVVQEDNSYLIKETIQVNFLATVEAGPARGIYRYIPLSQQVVREIDGEVNKAVYSVNMPNVKILSGHKVALHKEDGIGIMRFGDEDTLVNGTTQEYKLEYILTIGDDRFSEFDEFYLNIIGVGWTQDIQRVSFNITMPKPIDTEKIFFYSGELGSTDKANITFTDFTDTRIVGYLNGVLKMGNALTSRIELPQGYYTDIVAHNLSSMQIAALCVLAISLLWAIILFIANVGKFKPVETVEFYPPDDMTPLQLKKYFSGHIEGKDVASMVVYWANKGYLKINIDDSKTLFVEKIADLPSDERQAHKIIFDNILNLFSKATPTEPKKTITTKDVIETPSAQQGLPAALQTIGMEVGTRFSIPSMFMAAIPYVLFMIAIILVEVNFFILGLLNLIRVFWILGAICLATIVSVACTKVRFTRKVLLGTCIFATLVLTFAAYAILFSGWHDSSIVWPVVIYLFGAVGSILFVLTSLSIKYKKEYLPTLGKVFGFERTLRLTETERLKVLVKEDPEYFYNVLPYAYVLGINREFIKKFEGLAMPSPSWIDYNGADAFSFFLFMNVFNSFARSVPSVIRPYMSRGNGGGGFGGGGFGGGGFSGGGFGGGGGGRW